MSSINYIPGTVIPSTWLNDVDATVYEEQVAITRYGATAGSTMIQNKASLQAAITAFAAIGAVLVIPAAINYGYKVTDRTTWPDFTGVTKPMVVIDYGPGNSYAGFPTAYDGMQTRTFMFTPQTTSPGQHDGNSTWYRGSWHPIVITSNDADQTVRTALDNRRAGFAYYVEGHAYWEWIQGTLVGATLTNEEQTNMSLQKFAAPGDTLGAYSPYTCERKTGNVSYGGGRNIPNGHHEFERVVTSPVLPLIVAHSDTTTADILLRDSVGVADDITIKNVSGDLIFRLEATGDAIQVKKTTRRVQLTKALALSKVNVAYSASITPDSDAGNIFQVFASTGVAFTINAPVGTLTDGQEITIRISNTSGGALGVVTWNAAFKMATWSNPANGSGRCITFYYDASTPAWIEKSRNTSDIPN